MATMIQPPTKYQGNKTLKRSKQEIALDKSGWTVRNLAKYLKEHHPDLAVAHVNLWKRIKGETDWGSDELRTTCEKITGVKFKK